MASQRDITILRLIDAAANHLGNMAKWPESEATKLEADKSVKALRKFVKEDNYPEVFRYLLAVQIAQNLYSECINREVKIASYKASWIKLTELFD